MIDESSDPENSDADGVSNADRGESVQTRVGSGASGVTEADRRRLRQAQKLRENLQRRKQQLRSRRAGDADETDGLPAASTSGGPAANSTKDGD